MTLEELSVLRFTEINDNRALETDIRKPRGLNNLKKTCYQNSVVQCLTCCQSFVCELDNHGKKDNGEPVATEILRLM